MLIRTPEAVPAAAGWGAELDLSFAWRDGRTVLGRNQHRGPLMVQKALYPEGQRTCHVAILHPPGGIAAGDALTIAAALGARACALLTTPGATKWYRSEGARAIQSIDFSVGPEAVLEWLPRENIFFDGSDMSLNLNVDLASRARYFGWDIFSFGRRASGEVWRRGTLRVDSVIRCGGRVLWSEVAHVDAAGGFAQSRVGLAGFAVCGTFVVAGSMLDAAVVKECRGLRCMETASRTGITQMPSVFVARYLGDSTEAAFQWFTGLWDILRRALLGRAAHLPRVWAC